MTWVEIGRVLNLSAERVRQIAARALGKLRRRDPELADVFAAALRMRDSRSPAQQVIDVAPHVRGDYTRTRRPW